MLEVNDFKLAKNLSVKRTTPKPYKLHNKSGRMLASGCGMASSEILVWSRFWVNKVGSTVTVTYCVKVIKGIPREIINADNK